MIIYQSSPQKTLFEAILLKSNQWANKIKIVFHIVLRRVRYRGNHLLQILLKYWKHCIEL